jgi:dihydrofolate reductase
MSNNNVIGKDNRLPWYLPNDLHKFKEITLSKTKTMIMGRKTFESLPKILPDRHHIILTRNENYKVNDDRVTVINDMGKLKPFIENSQEYFVIGGSEIFSILFSYTKKMYITQIEVDIEGDTFFPEFNHIDWKITKVKEGIVDTKNKYRHKFITFERV